MRELRLGLGDGGRGPLGLGLGYAEETERASRFVVSYFTDSYRRANTLVFELLFCCWLFCLDGIIGDS